MNEFDTDRFKITSYDDESGNAHHFLWCLDCPRGRMIAEWTTGEVKLAKLTITARSHWERVHGGKTSDE